MLMLNAPAPAASLKYSPVPEGYDGPDAASDAWEAAYELALDAIAADAPDHLSEFLRIYWRAGYEAGALALEAERDAISDRYNAVLDAEVGRCEYEEQEACRASHTSAYCSEGN